MLFTKSKAIFKYLMKFVGKILQIESMQKCQKYYKFLQIAKCQKFSVRESKKINISIKFFFFLFLFVHWATFSPNFELLPACRPISSILHGYQISHEMFQLFINCHNSIHNIIVYDACDEFIFRREIFDYHQTIDNVRIVMDW